MEQSKAFLLISMWRYLQRLRSLQAMRLVPSHRIPGCEDQKLTTPSQLMVGHYNEWMVHLMGFGRIVDMKGGLTSLPQDNLARKLVIW